eukprot:Gb_32610 [translate_table: standard]
MQSGGHYGVPDMQQLMMERGPPRMFAVSPDMLSQPMKARLHQHHYLHLPLDHHYQHSVHQQHQQTVQQPLGLGDDSSENHSSFANRPAVQDRDPLTDDDGDEGGDEGDKGNSWPTEETLALLRIRSEMDFKFRDSNGNGAHLWEDVSRKLAELGFQRSAKACKETFDNVIKYQKKTKDNKGYRHLSELEAVCNGTISFNNGGDNVVSSDAAMKEQMAPKPEHQSKKKRKRKHLASIKTFFENLVKQLMENQEALHSKFLEAIERRDQERLMREEAWKRQEMARLTRETELRAQEQALASTREAAIVAFLQKITGQNLKLPQAAATSSRASEILQEDQFMDKEFSDPNGKRWPKPEVHALIRLRSTMEPKFQEPGPKGPLWQEISSGMASLGFTNRSAKRCKEKWENINKYFRKTKDTIKKRPENAKTCPYFHQLDTLYRKGILSSPNHKSNKLDHNHSSDALLEQSAGEGNKKDIDEHLQARSDSENILTIMPRETGEITPAHDNSTVYAFRSGDPLDQNQRMVRMKHNPPENNQESSKSMSPTVQGVRRNTNAFSDNGKAAKMERLVKEMLETQQQKFFEEFERREQDQDQEQEQESRDHNHDLTHDEISRQQINELKLIQERSQSVSQSALMALVDKLTAEIACDYSISAPPSTK